MKSTVMRNPEKFGVQIRAITAKRLRAYCAHHRTKIGHTVDDALVEFLRSRSVPGMPVDPQNRDVR